MHHGTRAALIRLGLVRGDKTGCGTPGHRHPGYVRCTEKGFALRCEMQRTEIASLKEHVLTLEWAL